MVVTLKNEVHPSESCILIETENGGVEVQCFSYFSKGNPHNSILIDDAVICKDLVNTQYAVVSSKSTYMLFNSVGQAPVLRTKSKRKIIEAYFNMSFDAGLCDELVNSKELVVYEKPASEALLPLGVIEVTGHSSNFAKVAIHRTDLKFREKPNEVISSRPIYKICVDNAVHLLCPKKMDSIYMHNEFLISNQHMDVIVTPWLCAFLPQDLDPKRVFIERIKDYTIAPFPACQRLVYLRNDQRLGMVAFLLLGDSVQTYTRVFDYTCVREFHDQYGNFSTLQLSDGSVLDLCMRSNATQIFTFTEKSKRVQNK